MATTTIADLWVPAEWVSAMRERQATFPSLFNSGIVIHTPEMDTIASGAGTSVNIPFFKDITDQGDEVQVENTAPVNDNNQPSGLMVASPLNRVTQNSASALSGQISGSDPVAQIISAMTARRLKQRQTTMLGALRGAFGSAGAANAAAPLSANRYGGTAAEVFLETLVGQAAANWISPTLFINAKALLGELADELEQGCFWCHPNIKAALENADALNFKTGVPSALGFKLTTYRGVPIFTSSALIRAGTTSGFVYDSYLLTKGCIGYGEKAQEGDTIGVASLSMFQDKFKNNTYLFDRTRFILALDGMKWVGVPAGQSATNAELATVANWNLVYQTAARVGAVCFRTNG